MRYTKTTEAISKFSDGSGKGTLSVFNANSQLVKQGILRNNKQEWSTTDLPPGVYYIQVTIENKIFKDKLVVIQ